MPIGIIIIPTILTMKFSERIIWDCSPVLSFFACNVSCEMYDSEPTFSSLALHSPETIKLPDMSSSPDSLDISSDSPVSSDSLAETFPSITTASALIWSPALNTTMSSSTSSLDGTLCSFPSRITRAVGAFSIESLSRTFFERISWIIPIRVLAIMIGINVRSR